MKPKRKALAIATAGTVLGLGGLGLIAIPAGAGEAPPDLPPISADKLVESALSAKTPALHGTVEMDNNLGLPALPSTAGMPPLDFESAAVHYSGNGKGRIAVHDGTNEFTMVHDGDTAWTYSSAKDRATKVVLPGDAHDMAEAAKPQAGFADPATAAATLLDKARQSSTISVDGTATVAGRSAYELVLTPKPTEKTLLRSIRVAVDSETRLPLRLSVMVNGTTEPALRIGFSELEFGPQPAELFRFSPPEGTEVTVREPDADAAAKAREGAQGLLETATVGDGWDTVLTGKLPAGALSGSVPAPDAAQAPGAERGELNPRRLLERIAEPVSGPFGSGYVVSLNGGNILITEDGRIAAGAVPQQVLVRALGAE